MATLRIKVKKGVPMKMDAGDNPTYEEWIKRVDRWINKYFGLSYDDLPDCRYYDWWKSRLRPIRAANRAIKNAGGYTF